MVDQIPRNLTLEEAHNERRDRQINELQQQLAEVLTLLRDGDNNQRRRRQRCQEVEGNSSNEASSESGESDASNQRYGRHRRQHDDFRDVKIEPPDYEGSLDPEDYLEWVQSIERVFEAKNYSDVKSFKVAVMKLKKYASLWYEHLKHQREQDGKRRIRSWSKLKRLMSKHFLPASYKQDLYIRMTTLKQGDLEVAEYNQEFEQLKMRTGVKEDPEQTIARYMGGLNQVVAEKIELQPYWTLDDVSRLALKAEKQLKKAFPKTSYSKNAPLSKASSSSNSEILPKSDKEKGKGREAAQEVPKKFDGKKCFKYHGCGHFQAECPNKRVLSTQEVEKINHEMENANNNEDTNELEESFVAADQGESLMIRRILHAGINPNEDEEQREQIFRTRCTIGGKTCNLVIDAGSCTNVASTTLVEKLKWPTTIHPHPYKLQWLDKGSQVTVNKQALISFSIGKLYKDEILCDVLPMDACHLLLGRPWEYDRNVTHDGRKNAYSLIRENRKITLVPLPPSIATTKPGEENTSEKAIFLSETHVERKIRSGKPVFLLYVQETQSGEMANSLQSKVRTLLEEFKDVFLEDLLAGLPPIRGIELHIDLILGATLPNRAVYRCSPMETKELQRQVEELIARGYIRESMSPCSVLFQRRMEQ